jgi:hypothetical protein
MGVKWIGRELETDASLDTRGVRLTTEARAADELKERLLGVFRSPGYVPPVLPRVALELMELTRRADVKLADVGRLLSQDPLIAAAVLRHAQSPVYSRGTPVQSLQDAVVRLGRLTVRDIFFEALTTARREGKASRLGRRRGGAAEWTRHPLYEIEVALERRPLWRAQKRRPTRMTWRYARLRVWIRSRHRRLEP